MLLHALYERWCTAPLNRLPCYGALEVIVTLLLLLLLLLLLFNLSDSERRLFDIPSVSTSGVRDWVAEIETLFDYATPR